jgi:hypothetical protein
MDIRSLRLSTWFPCINRGSAPSFVSSLLLVEDYNCLSLLYFSFAYGWITHATYWRDDVWMLSQV